MRTETDSLGERRLQDGDLIGINTLRASENFSLNYKRTNMDLIYAIVKVKRAAAVTYRKLNIRPDVYEYVILACDEVLAGKHDKWFCLDALQGGAGTSTNMNVNEVLANAALILCGRNPGYYEEIHPLNDINRGQSTNDVYPTALRIAAIERLRILSEECAKLQEALQKKENQYEEIRKLGRTELMDAVEITLGEEFGAYAQAIGRDRWRIYKIEERLRQVNIGGTAVGLSDTAARKYRFGIIEELRRSTGIGLAAAEYPMDITQNNDVFVEVSGLLKALAVNLSKIAGDFRLMNSGPYGGLGEIRLKALQQGSTIMPGKVNPVIPEMTMQAAIQVMANDSAISMAASRGEFELNAFLPLIADNLLGSLELLQNTVRLFREKCVELLEANEERCKQHLDQAAYFGVQYIEALGYDTVSHIITEYEPEKAKEILEQKISRSE